MSNWDWEVTVITESNYVKKVRVNNCITRKDAEAAALGMTGARRVVVSNPKVYQDNQIVNQTQEDTSQSFYPSYHEPEEEDDDEDDYQTLDKMEEEMYDLMCQIAIENGEELPTIQEFYDYLGK